MRTILSLIFFFKVPGFGRTLPKGHFYAQWEWGTWKKVVFLAIFFLKLDVTMAKNSLPIPGWIINYLSNFQLQLFWTCFRFDMNICSCMSKITMIIFIKTRSVLMKLLIDKYVVLVCSKFMHKLHLHIQTTTVQHSKKLSVL